MNLKLNNRFKSIAGLLLLVSLFFAMPSMAAQSDSTVVDTTVAVVTTAAVDSSAVVSDTAASATIADAATTVTTDTAKVEEVSTIDPQVYKNFFYYVLLFLYAVLNTLLHLMYQVNFY